MILLLIAVLGISPESKELIRSFESAVGWEIIEGDRCEHRESGLIVQINGYVYKRVHRGEAYLTEFQEAEPQLKELYPATVRKIAVRKLR